MSKKFIVGCGGTGNATEAVMWAAREAELRDVALRVVFCFDRLSISEEVSLGAPA